MAPRRRSDLYRLGVGLAAAALFVSSGAGGGAMPAWWLVATLALAEVLALLFPLHITVTVKVSVAGAVWFATALLVPMWQAAALMGASHAITVLLAAVRRSRATHEMAPLGTVAFSVLFNAGQVYLSVLAAGAVLAAAGASAHAVLSPEHAVAIAGAAVAMYVTNLLLVSTAVALATSRGLLSVLRNSHRLVLLQFAGLYLVGALAAFAATGLPWLFLLSLAGAFFVHRSQVSRIELKLETVRAMERMADEVDRRDPYTYQHSQRVAGYSKAIAGKLGLGLAEIELVELAAKVHDIGKIGLPDSVLLKPGGLTPEERRVMETHPRLGFQILRPFAEYAKVLDLVLTHHERYDGLGYPNGIVGRRQILIAQVIPVADSFDAMTSNRSYRPARTWTEARDELRRGAGSQWNPRVVEAALAVLEGEPGGVAVGLTAAAAGA